MLALAILLGWYVDRKSHSQPKLIGVWRYPSEGVPARLGYSSLLSLNENGSFSKRQNYRWGSEVFEGTYSVDDNKVVFIFSTLTSVQRSNPSPAHAIDGQYTCTWAIDKSGYLSFDAQKDWFKTGALETHEIEWEVLCPGLGTTLFLEPQRQGYPVEAADNNGLQAEPQVARASAVAHE